MPSAKPLGLLGIVLGQSLILAGASGAALAGEAPLRDVIDREVAAAWQRESITPAPPADDAAFLRRVYLDLCGTIPTAHETAAFLDDADEQKRSKLIDRLLDDPRFARQQADVWDLVLIGRDPVTNEARTRPSFRKWLEEQFAQNRPYDQWAGALLRAEGNTVDDGAPMFLVQYARRAEDGAEAISQTFLGVQLQCARCHDHPYESWTQLDFYGMAAFLARLQRVSLGKSGNESKLAVGEKNLGDVLFTGPAIDQEPGRKGDPVKPKFLHGEPLAEPELPDDFQEERNLPDNKVPPAPQFSRKDALAAWIASAENPYFARAIANRLWAQMMGRGLVHPVDNMSESNPPTHPDLLDELARAMIGSGFDIKHLLREICNSKSYQLASSGPSEEALPEWFERAKHRPLSAEELIASWRAATSYDGVLEAAGKKPPEERFYPLTGGYMLRFFGEPTTGTGDFQGGLHEHLYLNNGELPRLITHEAGGLLHRLAQSEAAWEEKVDQLFLAALSRRPDDQERARFAEFLSSEDQPQERLREALWSLLTCSEFRFNH